MQICFYTFTYDEHMNTKTIALINTKGGVGKTMSAIMFATALAKHGSVTLKDIDPQGSATEWIDRAQSAGYTIPFALELANKTSLARQARTTWTLIDTPPGDSVILGAAITAADFIIIPTPPGGMDVDRMWATLDVTRGKDCAVLITRATQRTTALATLTEIIEDAHIPVFDTIIHKREGLNLAFGTIPANLYDYQQATDELITELNGENK